MQSETLAQPRPSETASVAPSLVVRFTGTERWLHWVHTAGFLAMLVTGLALYLPGLTGTFGARPTIKAAHLVAVAAWVAALLLVVLLGNRRALRRTAREFDRFDADDAAWLRHGRRAPQGRFNAGQKLHAVLQLGFSALFVVSGTLLWLGERNNDFRLSGTIAVHDGAMFLAIGLLLGHLWLALVWPPTRHAMHGIVRGTVRADWARRHHVKWAAPAEPPTRAGRPSWVTASLSALVLAAGTWSAIALADDAIGGSSGPSPAATSVTTAAPSPAQPAAPAGDPAADPDPDASPLQLAAEAQQLALAGQVQAALTRYRLAVRGLPERPDIRTALGVTLVEAGNVDDGVRQLRRAAQARPEFPDARLYLGAVLLRDKHTAEGRRQLRRYLRSTRRGEGAALARQLLSGG